MRDCKRIIVTGGAGFIGRCFIANQLRYRSGREVVNLDNLTYAGNLNNVRDFEGNPNYKFVKGDICDLEITRKVINKGDFVVNFAAESHVDNSLKDSNPFYNTNVLGTKNLLESAREKEAGLFLQISTDEVYGSLSAVVRPSIETDIHEPTSPYSISKSQAERVCREFMSSLPVIITRSSNNFGPFQHPEKFIPRAITHLLDGEPIPLYGNGQNIRDWIYVSENCSALDFVISNGVLGEAYNVGGGNQTRNIDLARMMLNYLGLGEEFLQFVGDRKNHDLRYDLNCSKLHLLGFKSSKEGILKDIEETIDWYSTNKSWWEPLKRQAEEKYKKNN